MVQILIIGEACGHDAAIAVHVAGLATNGRAADMIGQRKASLRPKIQMLSIPSVDVG